MMLRYPPLLLVALVATFFAIGCQRGDTRASEVYQSEEYAHLSEADRDFLKNQEKNIWGFACHVADLLYFKHNGYTYEFQEMIDFHVQNPTNMKSILLPFEQLTEKRKTQTAQEVADELWARMQSELGPPPPSDPNATPLVEPLFMGHDRAQKIRFPEKYKESMIAYTQKDYVEPAIEAFRRGDRDEAKALLRRCCSERKDELGAEHAATKEAIGYYYRVTGMLPYWKSTGPNSWEFLEVNIAQALDLGVSLPEQLTGPDGKVVSTTGAPVSAASAAGAPTGGLVQPLAPTQPLAPVMAPAPAAAGAGTLADADAEIALAGEKWTAGDMRGAVDHAQKALDIRRRLLGDAHPKVAEVQQMLAAATQAAGGGAPQ